MIVVRDLTEVGPGDRRHVPALVEEAHDHGRLLHGLNDGAEQHTIEARVLKADALRVVLDERVHGGPLIDKVSGQHPIVSSPPLPAVDPRQLWGFQGAEPLPGSTRYLGDRHR